MGGVAGPKSAAPDSGKYRPLGEAALAVEGGCGTSFATSHTRAYEKTPHPCPPRSSPSSFIANIVGRVHPRYFPLPTNTACEPNESRACRRGERCVNPLTSSTGGSKSPADLSCPRTSN